MTQIRPQLFAEKTDNRYSRYIPSNKKYNKINKWALYFLNILFTHKIPS